MIKQKLLLWVSVFFGLLSFLNVELLFADSLTSPSCNPYLASVKTILLREQRKLQIKSMSVSFYPERNRLIGVPGKSKAEIHYVLGKPNAPIAILLVGLGSPSTVGYARYLMDHLNRMGLTVISVPSSFNMKSSLAFSAYMRPGLSSQDAADLLNIISVSVEQLTQTFHLSSSEKYLLGVSMGAFHVAAIFGNPSIEQLFSRYVLINPPLELDYGISVLDSLADGKGNIKQERSDQVREKLMPFINESNSDASNSEMMNVISKNHFGEKELGLFIGMKMRASVQQIIFASQQLRDDGLLKSANPVKRLYESHTWKIQDYFKKIAWPFYKKFSNDPNMPGELYSRLSIWKDIDSAQRPNDILILHAKDDFISRPASLLHLKNLPIQVVLSECGGHVGALNYPVYLQPLNQFLAPR